MKFLSEYFSDDSNKNAKIFYDEKNHRGKFIVLLLSKFTPDIYTEYYAISENHAEKLAEDWVNDYEPV